MFYERIKYHGCFLYSCSSSKNSNQQPMKLKQSLTLVLLAVDDDEHGLNLVLYTEILCHLVPVMLTQWELDWSLENLLQLIRLRKEQPLLFMMSPAQLTESISNNRDSSMIGKPAQATGCSYRLFRTKNCLWGWYHMYTDFYNMCHIIDHN